MADFFSQLTHRRSVAKDLSTDEEGQSHKRASPVAEADGPPTPQRDSDIAFLGNSGLFDREFYLANYLDVAASGLEPLEHFYDFGTQAGRRPNAYFDPAWYVNGNPDVIASDVHPLIHYVKHGDAEGRRPCPFFFTDWYRVHYCLQPNEGALLHYLQRRSTYQYSPCPDFDVVYYARNNPDVVAVGMDAFEHFFGTGFREGRNPSPNFDLDFYVKRFLKGDLSVNPFSHYIEHKSDPGVVGRMPDDEATIPREVRYFTSPGVAFEEFRPLPQLAPKLTTLLAYYLPQFHSFPENDAWWGKGFTEWTNLARGLPRFRGHYQPRIPRDLGFYSLTSIDILYRQVDFAQAAGVSGFIFYYYWFNGQRLLEKPVDNFLAEEDIHMPFALMWANENWTRRWDGSESEILITQNYREEDEALLLADLARHFADRRYIRLQSRPLLVIYRPGLIPDTSETIKRWRRVFRESFRENPILVMAQGFGDLDPTKYGLDGAIEFPPHKLTEGMSKINDDLEVLDPEFKGDVMSYDEVVRASLNEPPVSFPLIKTAIPSWDNDARRQGRGTTIFGSTPQKYETWLGQLVARASDQPFFGERLVCVNAWNEWAEGAYLEPDLHFGSAYLNATSRAVAGFPRDESTTRLLLVGHDAHEHGAQELLLNIGRTLRRGLGVDIFFLLLGGGRLEAAYSEIAPVTVVSDKARLGSYLTRIRANGVCNAIINTTASAHIARLVAESNIDCIALVHELPRIIREKDLRRGAEMAVRVPRRTVFPSAYVRDELLKELNYPLTERHTILPQGVYRPISYSDRDAGRVRSELGLTTGESLVLGVGYADLRKGFDIFLQLWTRLRRLRPRVHFCWIGAIDPPLREWLQAEIEIAENTGTFHLPGFTRDVAKFFSAASVFALTSREDPFPSVALEALSAGVPVVAFDRSGGIPELLTNHEVGFVVPYGDVGAMAARLRVVQKPGGNAEKDRVVRRALVANEFGWKNYVESLLELAMPGLARVSVVVPNFNYASHMNARLSSIFCQTYPVHEVLVLDDCSSDDSVQVTATVSEKWNRDIRLVVNETNSGSVFAQWRKAAKLSTGDFIWIAEADDLAEPTFLSRVLAPMRDDPSIKFAFSDSRAIDHDGLTLGESYKPYYSTIAPGALAFSQVFSAVEFVCRFLSVKNAILNVSAVVWRRKALLQALDSCGDDLNTFQMAGDWFLYQRTLAEPGAHVAYEASPLNVHRRHSESVTHRLAVHKHVGEIARMHEQARAMFDLSPDIKRQQEEYLKEVSVQLGAGIDTTRANTASGVKARRQKSRSGK